MSFDLIVIGGGSAGHAAARTAASLGLGTALIESAATLGGLCILRGCMPSKILIETANRMRAIREAARFGITTAPPVLDPVALRERLHTLLRDFREHREKEMTSGDYQLMRGSARFVSPHIIEVTHADGSLEKLGASAFVIATGSEQVVPDIAGLRDTPFWTSDDVVKLPEIPPRITILGSGAIGMEFAHMFEGFGSEVTVVLRGDRILSSHDPDISEAMEKESSERGIRFIKETEVLQIHHVEGRFAIKTSTGAEPLLSEALLIATGRRPRTDGLGLRKIGVALEEGRILADERTATSLGHIFAAGDCASTVPVVHLAVIQGEIAARNAARLLGEDHSTAAAEWNRDSAMNGLFTDPQAAEIGLNEQSALQHGIRSVAARVDYNDQGKGMIAGSRHGFVKVFAERDSGRLIGAAAVGPDALETSHVLQIAIERGLSATEYLALPHYHPSLAEAWFDAVASLKF